ncbi:MAG TPA: peptide chain release factor N(5)-glutamine methyltransferase [Thermoanaerobaculia bacterium]|nr:peptide chain release factor N(5)-glutamine methyltransferase [Thermoanaerobaculia bacterium]
MKRRVDELLGEARRRLAGSSLGAPPREAALLLARVLGLSEAALLAHPETSVDDDAERRFGSLLERRLGGEPVAYLFEEKEFYGRTFFVDRRVLVPRPETEHVVEAAIELARARERRSAGPRRTGAPRILDLGTGSGCVAITLALELPGAVVTGTDVSVGALAVAARNRRRHRAPVRLAAARTLDGIDAAQADLVVANLPYLDPASTDGLALEILRWEPAGALFGGAQGLDRFRELLAAATRLSAGTLCVLEIGADQARSVETLAAQYHLRRLETIRDYAGHDRVLVLVLERASSGNAG